jgi:hypothetical protein
MSGLAKLAAGVGGAAVAGFGLSAGRSAWKSTSRNSGAILGVLLIICTVGAAVVLPFIGGREFSRGHNRGFFLTLVLTFAGSLVLMAVGFGAGLLMDVMVQGVQGIAADPVRPRVALVAAATTILATVGVVFGLLERRRRKAGFAVILQNEAFLRRHGIRQTAAGGGTHIDGEGNTLRLVEKEYDRLVFLAVGRRNRRGYIKLSPAGQMTAYSGVVPINEFWDVSEDEAEEETEAATPDAPSEPSLDEEDGEQEEEEEAADAMFGHLESLEDIIMASRKLVRFYKAPKGARKIRDVLMHISDDRGWHLRRYVGVEASDKDAIAALIALSSVIAPGVRGSTDQLLQVARDRYDV